MWRDSIGQLIKESNRIQVLQCALIQPRLGLTLPLSTHMGNLSVCFYYSHTEKHTSYSAKKKGSQALAEPFNPHFHLWLGVRKSCPSWRGQMFLTQTFQVWLQQWRSFFDDVSAMLILFQKKRIPYSDFVFLKFFSCWHYHIIISTLHASVFFPALMRLPF